MSSARPLDGVLVADFSRVLAGPLATMMLADLGATVIKVERPGTGDDTRTWGPPWTTHHSSYFESLNRSKRSMVLDLTSVDGRAAAQELARRADVVVENFRTGVLDRFGLGYEDVRATNPAVVYCSITGFGRSRGADIAGYDLIVQAVGGMMSITGQPDSEPTKAGIALVDVLVGKDAVIGILAALRHRERTGVGQLVEVDLLSSCLAAMANQVAAFLATGESPGRIGNRHPSIAPYQTLRCADGLLAVGVGNDPQFRAFVRTLGVPELADDARFRTNPDRVRHRDALVAALERALAVRTVAEWEEALRAAGVPCGRVNDVGTALAHAAELGLESLQDMGPEYLPQIRNPVRLSATPPRPPSPPPALGEHTQELLAWLGEPSDSPSPLTPVPTAGALTRPKDRR